MLGVEPTLTGNILSSLKILYYIIPVALPLIMGSLLFNMWLSYRRVRFWNSKGFIILEIKLPREIFKSPLAMETALIAFYQTSGETTWIDRLWKGQTRPWFSLEMTSIGGNVRFFIWTWPQYKNIIESQFYAHYPGVEIYETQDYFLPYSYDPNKNDIWACEYKLTKPDPYPIKTYIDYGMDRDPKEEMKVDPISSIVEFLGSLTPGHNAFIQIMVKAHKKEYKKKGKWFEKTDKWKDEAEEEVKKIVQKFRPEEKEKQSRQPTEGERETIAALERSVSKLPFDVGIRSIYIADKDKYDRSNVAGLTGAFRQYSSQNLNGFAPTGWLTIFDYPWQEIGDKKGKAKKLVVEEFKRRRFFYSPYIGKRFLMTNPILSKPFVLNAEELATIYHFPGQVTSTPTFGRVPSKKSEAPSNLPI